MIGWGGEDVQRVCGSRVPMQDLLFSGEFLDHISQAEDDAIDQFGLLIKGQAGDFGGERVIVEFILLRGFRKRVRVERGVFQDGGGDQRLHVCGHLFASNHHPAPIIERQDSHRALLSSQVRVDNCLVGLFQR